MTTKKLSFLFVLVLIAITTLSVLKNTVNRKGTNTFGEQALKNGLHAMQGNIQGESCYMLTLTQTADIGRIPKSTVPLSLTLENCMVESSKIELLFDGRVIRGISFVNCSFDSAGLRMLSSHEEVEEFSFDSCRLKTESLGEYQRFGRHLIIKKCETELTNAILTCIGNSSRVFVEPLVGTTVELEFLKSTEQLTLMGCPVVVHESFAQSKFLSVLNFLQVEISGKSISHCLDLDALAFLGIDRCDIDDIQDISIAEQYTKNLLINATGKELIDRLREILPRSVSVTLLPPVES